ncbi:MAG: asparagine synthase-related protein [bacterium]
MRDERPNGHFARARVEAGGLALARDPIGVVPLYHGRTASGDLCFASEVKALLEVTDDVNSLPPGHVLEHGRSAAAIELLTGPRIAWPAAAVTAELHRRLRAAVERAVAADRTGAWLSGGLDSSAIVALARPLVRELHTFAAGLTGAPDLEFAREVAGFVGSVHHEIVIRPQELPAALPEVIRHLESFDALLVRSSIANYLAGKVAAGHVTGVLSGEGGDELFAGYDYLKALDPALLADELLDITHRLHDTALQRVDRCSAAHGLLAHVPFLDPAVASFALRIGPELKIRDGVEKWILRRALDGLLPGRVLARPKAKFWQGAGIGELLAEHAERHVTDADFRREMALPDGSLLNSKEELLYWRVFRERFGRCRNLDWMGRTKGAPVTRPA